MSLCDNCIGACCQVLIYAFVPSASSIEYFKARGALIIDGYAVFQHTCPNLDNDCLCRIYQNRPQWCRKFKVGSIECVLARKYFKEMGRFRGNEPTKRI